MTECLDDGILAFGFRPWSYPVRLSCLRNDLWNIPFGLQDPLLSDLSQFYRPGFLWLGH